MNINLVTNKAGMLMFNKALEEEAKKQLSTGQGLWQQLEENGYKAQYKSITIDTIEQAIGEFFGKSKKKRIRRKMNKHGKTI